MVELVDALDSKSSTVRCVGSSPTGGTINPLKYFEKANPLWENCFQMTGLSWGISMKKYFYAATAAIFAFMTATSASAEMVKGQAGEFYPYGKTYDFESVYFSSTSEGAVLRLPLPKNIVAYLVVPPGGGNAGFQVTPYLSMPTTPKAPALPDDLGYGFELMGTGLNERGSYNGYIVFDLDQGKTVAEINKSPKLRKYCSPEQTTFNPQMCALKTGTPVTEHTSAKYAVVSPIRSDDHTNLMTMFPTVPVGFDNLVVAEVNTFGTIIPVKLNKEALKGLIDANNGDVSGMPFFEAVAHALAEGRKDKAEELRSRLYMRTDGEMLKAMQLFRDDPNFQMLFREQIMERSAWGRGRGMTSAMALLLRLENGGWNEAGKLREELVQKSYRDFKEYNEGFRDFEHSYDIKQFDTIDAMLAGLKIGANDTLNVAPGLKTKEDLAKPTSGVTADWDKTAGEVANYIDDHLKNLVPYQDDVSDSVFLRGAEAAHELGAGSEGALANRAYNRAANLASEALSSSSPAEIRNAITLLKASGITSTDTQGAIEAKLEEKLGKAASERLKASLNKLRKGVNADVLEDVANSLSSVYIVGKDDPDKLLVTYSDGGKKDKDKDKKNIRIHRDKDKDGGKGDTGTEDNTDKKDDSDGGSGEDGNNSDGDNSSDDDGDGGDGSGGVSDGGSASGGGPCEPIEVDRKNLHNFADQTHWMRILDRLKAANFQMNCGDDSNDDTPADDEDEEAERDDTPPPPHDDCAKLRDQSDAAKKELIEGQLGATRESVREVNEALDIQKELRKDTERELNEVRAYAQEARKEAEANPGDASLKANADGFDQAAETIEGKMTLQDRSVEWLQDLKKTFEDLLKEMEDTAKDSDIDRAVCKMSELGKRAQKLSQEENPIQPEMFETPDMLQ